MKKVLLVFLLCFSSLFASAQINVERVVLIGRNALYFEDYILAIQYFNQAIKAKPNLAEPYYYRAIAKYYLDDIQGTEEDCTLALERNPFMTRVYQLRADARKMLESYDEAVKDYDIVLEALPNDKFSLISKGIVTIQKKEYDDAEHILNQLLKQYPTYAEGYLTRGTMHQEKGDTIKAFADYGEALKIDKYMSQGYSIRGLLYYNTFEYDKSIADFDEAIKLEPLVLGNYINRGLVRYSKNDLRGAMADYDKVIDLESNNIIARFNRGLLRSQVGDDNRAIVDFDVVLESEPDNDMAYLNRSLVKKNIGDYKGAINDINKVLTENPDFYQGFYMRSDIKRRQNDLRGAEKDYNFARSEENRTYHEILAGVENKDDDKTREKSNKDLDKFNKLVVADKSEQEKSKYDSKNRGRIQNKQVQIEAESRFVVTYYEKPNEIKRFVYFNQMVDSLNKVDVLPKKLRITNSEASLVQVQIDEHFKSIDDLSLQITRDEKNELLYFARALDYMLVQDFASAIENYEKAIELNPKFALAYFNLGVVYAKQIDLKENTSEMEKKTGQAELEALGATTKKEQSTLSMPVIGSGKAEYDLIVRCMNKVTELSPGLIYAYYNRADVRFKQQDYRAAILDYNEAIKRDSEFAEAYFNRGLARFFIKDKSRGLEDMRKAGELGIAEAYSIIKRMTE